MSQVFKNGARTELDAGISASTTQFTVIDGTIFPVANASVTGGAINQTSGAWFKLVLQDDEGNFEIVYCYDHGNMTHTFTVLRGQEGTTARAFLEGTTVGLRLLSSDLDTIHSNLTLLGETKQEKTEPAAKADALTAARSITLSGAVQANATWDASGALELVTNNIDVSKANGGTLVVGRGGTGTTSHTAGQVLVGNGSNAITSLAIDTTTSGTAASGSLITSGAVNAGLALKANLASPALTGIPTAPTATTGTNTTQLATTAFVQTSAETRVASSEKGAANGVATLDATGKVPAVQLPSYVDDVLEFANLAAFPATGESGKIYVALDTNKTYRWSGSAYVYITSGAVDSVAGKTGVVTLVKADVGLSNVDNTADSAKPVSTAQQTALNLKANLASPALTGTPTAPTAADGTSSTQLATTAFVQGAVGGFLSKTTTGGTTTLTTAEASNPIIKVSGALTSNAILEIPVASKRNYSIENATTGAFTLTVKHVGLTPSVLVAQGKRNIVMTNGVGAYDAINDFESVALTGTPTAPTAGSTTNNTQVATTAFVQAVNAADTGSAATAVKLKTARTIGGVSFDGSANINLPGVNTAGNQNTTGSAATLTTARTINGTSFNGSANITTANWGTSRNLTIGDTAKAVNGSANVAWTLAEIGAFPAANVVGTMAGGAVIERGNNANGEYVKFADGTLIAFRFFTADVATSNGAGNGPYAFPVQFYGIPATFAQGLATDSLGSGSVARLQPFYDHTWTAIAVGAGVTRIVGLRFLSVGRWK